MRHPIQLMVLAWLLAVPGGASAQSGGSFDLSWSSIGGGGSRSTGTGFTLQGLVASWNSGQSTGGTFTLQGGWGGPIATTDAPVAPIPAAFAWQPARPNPFFDRSSIEFGLPHSSHVQLAVFDISGRRLRLLVDEFLAEGVAHYQASVAIAWRAVLRVARGDVEGAVSDAERALELSRPANDPQLKLMSAEMATMVFLSAGDRARASATLDEALVDLRELRQTGFPVVWLHGLAWVASALGRADEVLEAVEDEPADTPWLRAGRAVAFGDFPAAADIFAGMPAPAFEAFFRLRAAEALVAEGRRAEADEQLRPALAFYRGVAATRYVREGEALLAASA